MKNAEAREKAIAIGMELISGNGYNSTGVDAILKGSGLPKGSFYHYFGTKEDFGLEVINSFAESYEEKLKSFLEDGSVSPLSRIRNYLEHGLSYLAKTDYAKGCLIGNLGQELAGRNERFRARLEEVFRSWQTLFAACLAEAKDRGELARDLDAEKMAGFILSGWEGAILRAKVMKSPGPVRDFIDALFGMALARG